MNTAQQTIVKTKNGSIDGFYRNGLFIFKGIPYAAPPTGRLRWHPPQPVESWTGIRPAKEYGSISPQSIMPGGSAGVPSFADRKQSEDCLSLNIWTPGLDDEARPVMVWIHGGGFIMGAGTEGFLEDGILSRRGKVVMVSINYRLGALGFMNLKEITGGKIPATGNEGLLDQIAALEWIRKNIQAFGGDPNNITISGFSAGAMSVGTLLSMPAAHGKFHKAMNRSGAASMVSSIEKSVRITEKFLRILNIKKDDVDDLYCLNNQQIIEAQQKLSDELKESEPRLTPFMPVLDNENIPDMPINIIRNGFSRNIPLLSGSTRDEMKFMSAMDPSGNVMDEAEMIKKLSIALPGQNINQIIKVYRESFRKQRLGISPGETYGGINSDMTFRMPVIKMIEAQQEHGTPAFNYIFTYKSPALNGKLGAIHGLDNPFLFGSLDKEFTGNDNELEHLAQKIQDSCIAFLETGDPSCKSSGTWPVYGNDRMTMIFDRKSHVEAAPFDEERAAWEGFDV